MPDYRKSLIQGGIRNLTEFGYQSVTEELIVKDYVYSKFFESMLQETMENPALTEEMRVACELLLKEIEVKQEPA